MGFHPDTFRRQSETAIRLRQAESLRSIATDLTGPLGNERPFVLQGPATAVPRAGPRLPFDPSQVARALQNARPL